MCPYARFQSAMFDKDTLIITYDADRGGGGGIDIRKGLQYECIACAACIDACDEVMDKVGYPKGLIRYDTHNGLERQAKAYAAAAHDHLRLAACAADHRLRRRAHAPQRGRRGRDARPQCRSSASAPTD